MPKMKMPNNYAKNVAKSLMFASVDVVKDDLMPNVGEFAEDNKAFFSATYATLRNPKSAVKKQINAFKESKIYTAIDYGSKNLFEDLRTGNFYNKERENKDALKFSGLNVDDWDDLSEFGIDDDWESNIGKEENDVVTLGDKKVINAIEGSSAAATSTTVNAIAAASDRSIKTSRVNTGILYEQNERLFGGIHNDLSILNATMDAMLRTTSTSVANIDKNSAGYFTEALKLDTERNTILKEMLELQRNQYKTAVEKQQELNNRNNKNKKRRWSDITSNGLPNFEDYAELIKDRIINEVGSMGVSGFNEDSNMLASMMTSPLKGLTTGLVKGLIPATLKVATKEFDQMLTNTFGTVMARMVNERGKDGSILGILGKFLGVNASVDRSINTSKYFKGPVPFDGLTRKAIVDVIPTYLRRIEAALTGREESMYDYDNGKWTTARQVDKDFKQIKKNYVRSSTSELRSAMNPYIKSVVSKNADDAESLEKAYEEFWEYLYEVNGDFNPKKSVSSNGISAVNYPNLYKHYKIVATTFSEFGKGDIRNKDRITNLSTRMVSSRILSAKDSENKQYRDIEQSVSSVFSQYFGSPKTDVHGKFYTDYNGKETFKANHQLLQVKDSEGNNIFDYLRMMSKELIWQREYGFGFGGKGSNGGNNTFNPSMTRDQLNSIVITNAGEESEDSSNSRNMTTRNNEAERKALEKINKGEAIDLRDFSSDEQKALLNLSDLIRKQSIDEYAERVNGLVDENTITRFLDKHIFKTKVKTVKDLEKIIKDADKEGKNTDEIVLDDESESNFVKSIMQKFKKGKDYIADIASAPFEVFENVLYTADRAIYDMLFKAELRDDEDDDHKEYKGVLDMLSHKINDKFKDIADKFKEDVLDPLREKLGLGEGEFGERFKAESKRLGKSALERIINANKEVYSPIIDAAKDTKTAQKIKYARITNATKNRLAAKYTRDENNNLVRKSEDRDYLSSDRRRRGRMSALSGSDQQILKEASKYGFNVDRYGDNENKLINIALSNGISIHDIDNMRKYAVNENGDYDHNKFIVALSKSYLRIMNKNHARGTFGKPFMGNTMLSKGELLFNNSGISMVNSTGAYSLNQPTHIMSSYDSYPLTNALGLNNGPRRTPNQDLAQENVMKNKLFRNAFGTIANHASGSSLKISGGIDSADLAEAADIAKKYLPEGAAGGVAGGVLALLLGTVGGPLVGAALGAGASIISNSNELKDKLFGAKGEDGKRQGGKLFDKKIMDAINKYMPDTLKYAAAGIIPGLITPLGPLGGILVGGAIGALKNNEKFTNRYFGEEGKLTLSNKTKDIISKMLPGAAKGATVGTIAGVIFGGPFGLLGNAALGSAVGMMASTEDFKDMILGKEIDGKRYGGLVGELKQAVEPFKQLGVQVKDKLLGILDNQIAKPLKSFIEPAISRIPRVIGLFPSLLGKAFEGVFHRSFGDILRQKFTEPIAKLASGLMNNKVINTVAKGLNPLNWIGGLGNIWRGRDIKNGKADYMSATDIVEWMNERGKSDKISKWDMARAGIEKGQNLSQAKELSDKMDLALNSSFSLQSDAKKKHKELTNVIRNYESSTGKKLDIKTQKYINNILNNPNGNSVEAISNILSRNNVLKGGGNLSNDELKALQKELSDKVTSYQKANELYKRSTNIKDKDSIYNELKEKLEANGVKIKNRKDLIRYSASLKDSILYGENYNGAKNPENDAQLLAQNVSNELLTSVKSSLEDIVELMKMDMFGKSDHIKEFDRNAKDDIRNGKLITRSKLKHNSNSVYSIIGKEKYNEAKKNGNLDSLTRSNDKSGGIYGLSYAITDGLIGIKQPNLITNQNITIRLLSILKNKGFKLPLEDEILSYLDNICNDNNKVKRIDLEAFLKVLPKKFCSGRLLSKDDIDFMINNTSAKNEFKNKTDSYIRAKLPLDNIKSFREMFNYDSLSIKQASMGNKLFNDMNASTNTPQPANAAFGTISNHGFGTTLLGLAGSAVRGITNLFKGKSEDNSSANPAAGILGALSSARNTIGGFFNGKGPVSGNTDEVDKAGDGKDVVITSDGTAMKFKRNQDNSVTPDTTDAPTKNYINKMAIKEKAQEKFQEISNNAMSKLSEILTPTKDKAKKGLSIGGLILGGALLSPLLKKVYEGAIKPLWNNVIHPFITDKVKPYITDQVIPTIKDAAKSLWDYAAPRLKDFWDNKALPFLHEDLPYAIGRLIAYSIKNIGPTIESVLNGVFSGLIGKDKPKRNTSYPQDISYSANANNYAYNKYGGSTPNINYTESYAKELNNGSSSGSGQNWNEKTTMKDSNGNNISKNEAIDIINNGGSVYNENGGKVELTSDGLGLTVDPTEQQEDEYKHTYRNTVLNAILHTVAQGKGGVAYKISKGVSKLSGKLLKSKGFLGKGIGIMGKALSEPQVLATDLTDNAFGLVYDIKNKGFKSTIDDIYKASKDKISSKVSNLLGKNGDKVTKAASGLKDDLAESAVKGENFFTKAVSKIKNINKDTIIDSVKNNKWVDTIKRTYAKFVGMIDKILSNSVVEKKLKKVAKDIFNIAEDQYDNWLLKFKEKYLKVAQEGLDKATKEVSEKVGKDAAKSLASKVLSVVFCVIDFAIGCDQAESILKVKETDILEEVVAGLYNMFCNLLIIPAIVPGVGWFATNIIELFHDDIRDRQKETEEWFEKYQDENMTTYSDVNDYLKKNKSYSGKAWESIKEKASAMWDKVKNSKIVTTVKDTASSVFNTVTGWFGGGKYGRGYKQIDPAIASIPFNVSGDTQRQTIGDSACGPAAAVEALHSVYGRGSSAEILGAANYALKGGYKEINGGTKPKFFNDYFAANGVDSSTSYDRGQLRRNIMNGQPTVLMGQDKGGVNDRNPYGPNPHYITVTGTDGRGNVIVQDPESRYDNQLYRMNDVLNKSSLGVSAYGRSKLIDAVKGIGKVAGSVAGYTPAKVQQFTNNNSNTVGDDIASQVWGFLKSKGCTDAAAAGIMGNLQQESGMDPTKIQGNGKGPAAGICQWENYNTKSARWKALSDYASSRGTDWTDLATQLEFMWSELPGCAIYFKKNTPISGYEELIALNDYKQACEYFEKAFERAGTPMMENRYKYAAEFLQRFAGTMGSGISSTVSGNEESGLSGIFGQIQSAFDNSGIGKLYSTIFGGSNSTDGTSGSSSISNIGNASAAAVVNAAMGEIGYKEGPNNDTKYGQWYGMNNQPWCDMFVSWATNQAGVPEDVNPKSAYTVTHYDWFAKKGQTVSDPSQGQPGDIIFFSKSGTPSGISHVGIVEDVSNGEVHTIEGNHNNMVDRGTYSVDNSKNKNKILLTRPAYPSSGVHGPQQFIKKDQFASMTSDFSAYGGNADNKPLSRYGMFSRSINSNKNVSKTSGGYVPRKSPQRVYMRDANNKQFYAESTDSLRKYNKYGRGNQIDYSELITTVINILIRIADNSDKLETIAAILSTKLGSEITTSDLSNATKNSNNNSKSKLKQALSNINNQNTDSISSILNAMNAIASE